MESSERDAWNRVLEMDPRIERLENVITEIRKLIDEEEYKLGALQSRLADAYMEKAKVEVEKSCRVAKWEALRAGEDSAVRQAYVLSQEHKELVRMEKAFSNHLAAADSKWSTALKRVAALKKSRDLIAESLSETTGKKGAVLARLIYLKK